MFGLLKRKTLAQKQGQKGECLAFRFLKKEGYKVLSRNWRSGRDEIDIVAMQGDILVFVEVKARVSSALVRGYYSVDKKKKQNVKRCAQAYLNKLIKKPKTFRFDIIEVQFTNEKDYTLNHFTAIPLFGKHYQG